MPVQNRHLIYEHVACQSPSSGSFFSLLPQPMSNECAVAIHRNPVCPTLSLEQNQQISFRRQEQLVTKPSQNEGNYIDNGHMQYTQIEHSKSQQYTLPQVKTLTFCEHQPNSSYRDRNNETPLVNHHTHRQNESIVRL